MLDLAAYFARIGYSGTPAPTLVTLANLHLAHLRTVPFENLDIHLGRPIRLEEDAFFAKIVRRRRGGFCFELNGLFAALLRELGFGVTLLAAQYPRDPGQSAPEFDHLTLLVRTTDSAEPWLAEVGAGGDSPARPLRLVTGIEQDRPETGATYRLEAEENRFRLYRRERGGDWERRYAFSLRPRALTDFEAGNRYHQTSSDSHFTQGRVCSLPTPTGRVTLTDGRLIVTADGERTERELADESAFRAALRNQFGIDLDA